MTLAAANAEARLSGRTVLKDFSLAVAPGEIVVLAGPNGAGKSTALKLLTGLIAPQTGAVTLEDRPLAEYDLRDLARAIAYLPQDRTVHWSMPCERVVALGRLPHRRFSAAESAADQTAINDAMASMDVSQFSERPIATLSGGERARVLVARALAQQARYIATDEPTAGLDPAHSLRLFQEFKRLSEKGHAIVTALHDLSLAARYATRVVLLKDGACIASGPTAQVLSRENLAKAFSVDAFVTEIGGFPVVLPVTPLT